ncbi:antibiotic biosynthesis monooxygenase family protein [Fulvimonas yonginensis]|uniref:Antibiotic biosynthesis monooxygenase family protein n=1 Tax=Fulvimonas yonginensis TaxID=1495200 RepID=A0ABU8JDJ3_9GAMM
MIVEYIRYRIAPADAASFERDYAEAAKSLDASQHCLGYELARCQEEPACYMLRIEWVSAKGHLRGFRGSDLFQPFLAAIRPYIGAIEEMRHYERTEIRSSQA